MTHGPTSEWVAATPAPALRPFVDGYVGYRLAGFAPGVHRGLPSRHMTFIVSIGAPIDVLAQSNPRQAPDRYRCTLGGLQETHALIVDPGAQEGVAIDLTPLGARVLFGMPARELWDTSIEFADVVGGAGDELWEQVQIAHGWDARFAACDDVLARLAVHDPVAIELSVCWELLSASHGTVTIAALAAETGYSRQHLTRRFRDEFGLSPKRAGRVMRFDRARRLLASPDLTVGRVAAQCGYADQAHLARDVAAFAGCTPSELLLDHVPFVQDEVTVGG
ncbi:MAG TPA: helix-turn-helix transcriptional regulator [Acidimicrobiia bacterium]